MRFTEKIKNLLSMSSNTPKNKDNLKSGVHVFDSTDENVFYLRGILRNSQDIVYRHFYLGSTGRHATLVYIEGMVEKNLVEEQVIKPILRGTKSIKGVEEINIYSIKNNMISASRVAEYKYIEDLIQSMLSGNTILFVDGFNKGISIESKGASKRSVGVTTIEQTVRGSQEGFVEDLIINITQIRRRIKDSDLSVELLKVGERTHTDIGVIYINKLADQKIVDEVKSRINSIKVDGFMGSAQLEQLIERHKWSLFPQMMTTERPDRAAANILKGKVVMIMDGSPFVLIVPTTLSMLLSSPDDYYERAVLSSMMRMLRYISFMLATTLPGAYIALTAFHPGMIPTKLVLSITGTRTGLPFPVFIEIILMEVTIDILQEAATRLPKPIGSTIGIIGGIIIGQAAVQAGIVSPTIVIIVSMTSVAAFALPVYTFTQSTRVIRSIIIIAASLLGIYGVVIVWINLLIHIASLETFGVRYLNEFSPINSGIVRNTIIKMPLSLLKKREEDSGDEEDKQV